MTKSWRDVNVIYQIYPRSFKDSDGDGVGDLRGVITKLDYIKGGQGALGADAIWISPFFPSPMADFGYDVSDYCDVHPLFGTLDDMRTLIKEAHARDIKVMIDFVPNHTSNQHPWFIESAASRDNPYRDFYVWRDPKSDGSPPNNWLSIFGGSAWEFDETTGQYYLHTFLKEQPDLDWSNPKVRWEMRKVLKFWCDMGIDGIRADAVRWIAKDPDLGDDAPNPHYHEGMNAFESLRHNKSRYGRDLFRYLRELTDVIEEYPDCVMIFEDYPDDLESTRDQYLGFYSVNPRVSMPFNFQGMWVEWNARSVAEFVNEFQGMLLPEHVPVYCFSNHDQARLVTRFGADHARLVAVLQFTLPGLPVMYYGDEIGMENGAIPADRIQDPVEIRKRALEGGGVSPEELDEQGMYIGRDPERTPMQWDATAYAGFSTREPWLPVADNYPTINVAAELSDAGSNFALYRTLLYLRTQHPVLRSGDYLQIPDPHPDIFRYRRINSGEKLDVILNFSAGDVTIGDCRGDVICSSYMSSRPEQDSDTITLRANEGVIILRSAEQ